MVRPRVSEFRGARRFASVRPELKVGDVQPFGATGIGLLTGHPVGLVTIGGIFLLAIELVPPVRVFFLASVFFGSLIGLVLWLLHR